MARIKSPDYRRYLEMVLDEPELPAAEPDPGNIFRTHDHHGDTLRLHDTLTRSNLDVQPGDGVTLRFSLLAAATVYGPAHIGNFRIRCSGRRFPEGRGAFGDEDAARAQT